MSKISQHQRFKSKITKTCDTCHALWDFPYSVVRISFFSERLAGVAKQCAVILFSSCTLVRHTRGNLLLRRRQLVVGIARYYETGI